MEAYLGTVLMRTLHILFGILWIGLLYYFNFVQTEYFKESEADAKSDVVKKLVPNALWYFRWAAALTVLSGLILASFLIIHLFQLRFPRPEVNFELASLKNNLESIHNLVLYSLASIALFFHMIQGIESGHRTLGILNPKNSSNIRYAGRFISILFGLSFLVVTFYLRFI